jgi:hypothetical protein
MSSKLVTGGILAIVGLIAIKVVMFIIGGTVAILALVFKLLPILLIGWLLWRLMRSAAEPKSTLD